MLRINENYLSFDDHCSIERISAEKQRDRRIQNNQHSSQKTSQFPTRLERVNPLLKTSPNPPADPSIESLTIALEIPAKFRDEFSDC